MARRFILFTFMFFVLAGCGTDDNESLGANEQNQQYMEIKNSTIDEVNDRDESERISKHLSDLAAAVPDVRQATAVVLGKYAIVGIDVDKDLDRSKVGTVKYSVAEALKDDPHGARAVVVADPDIYARLQEIGEDIQNGQPVRGILNELADITGRIMPEIPGQLQDPHPEQLPENQKNDMKNEDEKQLEQEQQDQSKGHKNQ